MFFETSIIPEYPRYHSNCAAIALHHSVSSNKPFTFTQHHGKPYYLAAIFSDSFGYHSDLRMIHTAKIPVSGSEGIHNIA